MIVYIWIKLFEYLMYFKELSKYTQQKLNTYSEKQRSQVRIFKVLHVLYDYTLGK